MPTVFICEKAQSRQKKVWVKKILLVFPKYKILSPIYLLPFQLCNSKNCCSESLCFILTAFVNLFISSFLCCFPYSYCPSNVCCSFMVLKAKAKSKKLSIDSKFQRVKTLEREIKNKAMKKKSYNFRNYNREKSIMMTAYNDFAYRGAPIIFFFNCMYVCLNVLCS